MDMANVYVRAAFTSIPGLVGSPPFGGNIRTIVIKADPELLRSHQLTPDQLVEALRLNNQISPGGNVRIGDYNYLTPANTVIKTVKDFEGMPLYKGGVQNLYLRDVATVEDGADITMGYALVNGKRSVYLSIAKSADASTWEVVQKLKEALPKFQAQLPEDVKLSYEFDQSVYVMNAVKSLLSEGAIGAILTGLMVLMFLGDARGALIVILTIPTSIIAGVLFLQLFGQTINIMTLSGLSLAIGILVDESTVTIENIHQHLDMGKPKAKAIWDACKEIAFPKLLILFCILAVFAPAFTMQGIPGSLFLPLSLAIGFSMIVSYLLSQTFVPIMANWIMKGHKGKQLAVSDHAEDWELKAAMAERTDTNRDGKLTRFEKFRTRYMRFLDRLLRFRKPVAAVSLILAIGAVALLLSNIGRDVLPKINGSQFQVRLKAPEGMRIERTEEKMVKMLAILDQTVGKENVAISSAFVGQHPALFSISPIYLFTGGPHEAVLQVALQEGYKVNMDELKEKLRAEVAKAMPEVMLSFEPIELTDKILSQGSPTPVEVRIGGRNKKLNEAYAYKLMDKLHQISYLRDIQIAQPIKYPALNINIDRVKAAQLGLDMSDISRSIIASTSSSRYTEKNVWLDEKAGLSYSVQVQIPENKMASIQSIGEIPVLRNAPRPVLSDVATIEADTTYGENDNLGPCPSFRSRLTW